MTIFLSGISAFTNWVGDRLINGVNYCYILYIKATMCVSVFDEWSLWWMNEFATDNGQLDWGASMGARWGGGGGGIFFKIILII